MSSSDNCDKQGKYDLMLQPHGSPAEVQALKLASFFAGSHRLMQVQHRIEQLCRCILGV